MNEMYGVTQQNAALVLEATYRAEELKREAQHLANIIAVFDLGGQICKSSTTGKIPFQNKITKTSLFKEKGKNETNWEKFWIVIDDDTEQYAKHIALTSLQN